LLKYIIKKREKYIKSGDIKLDPMNPCESTLTGNATNKNTTIDLTLINSNIPNRVTQSK